MARPEWLTQLALNSAKLTNTTARNVIQILELEGPAFATPSAMTAALTDSAETVSAEELYYIYAEIPEPSLIEFSQVEAVKTQVVRNALDRHFIGELAARTDIIRQTKGRLSKKQLDALSSGLRQALTDYDKGIITQDQTAGAILKRMKSRPAKVRWKCGGPEIDDAFNGIAPMVRPVPDCSPRRRSSSWPLPLVSAKRERC